VAGVAALREIGWITDKLARILAGRRVLETGLTAIPGLRIYPSATNFLLVRVRGGQTVADALHLGLQERGILVRRYSRAPLDGCLRISVGTEEQNAILLEEVCRLCPTS
jgi:histidinol-phosphate aminotransferase